MARSVKDSKLDTRTSRLKLEAGLRHFRSISEGVALCYRRTSRQYGTWGVRLRGSDGVYKLVSLGIADDTTNADGVTVLTFLQAQEAARKKSHAQLAADGTFPSPATVEVAAQRYLDWYRDHRRSLRETKNVIDTHILAHFGPKQIAEITAPEIMKWHEGLAATPARKRSTQSNKTYKHKPKTSNEKRARRATANRILTVFKAILNRAFREELVADDKAWRKVKPFPKTDDGEIRYLDERDSIRLINSCEPALRLLVQAALFTGARYGELTRLLVRDVQLDTNKVFISSESKSGKGRYIPLSPSALAFFSTLIAGKEYDAPVFTKLDGTVWGKNHHVRLFIEANEKAKLAPPITFHDLRHTFATHFANIPGNTIDLLAAILGHADTRITKRHYAHLFEHRLLEAVSRMPTFGSVASPTVVALR